MPKKIKSNLKSSAKFSDPVSINELDNILTETKKQLDLTEFIQFFKNLGLKVKTFLCSMFNKIIITTKLPYEFEKSKIIAR